MNNGLAFRTPRVRLLLATAGIVLVGIAWTQFGAGDSQPMSVSEPAVSLLAAPATKSEASPATEVPVSPGQLPATATPSSTAAKASSPDEELKAKFLGIWTHSENGDHWIENRPDGTARMLLKLDFFASLLYGKQAHMDLTWDVKDGVLTHTVVSGTPIANVNNIVKDYGKSRHYTILETTPERMLLQSLTDKQKDLWTRTPAPQEWKEEPAAKPMGTGQKP
jgi:hypothetical protein